MPPSGQRRTDETRAASPQPKGGKPAPRQAAAAPGTVQRALADPACASPPEIQALQRKVGNRATARLTTRGAVIQAKLAVGPADDKYEQEADRVAGEVTRSAAPASPPAAEGTEAKGQAQRQPLSRAITPLAQRTAPVGEGGGEAGSEVESRLAASQGSGSPLPAATRQQMEPRFGADFGRVRVHADGEAAQLNRKLSAQAFTHGSDIYMGEGKYQPGTSAGDRLLAHELTHVVQQGAATGALQTKPDVIQREDGEEEEDVPEQGEQPEAPEGENEQNDLPLFMKLLKWGFVDQPKGAYRFGRKRGWGKVRSGGLALGEGLLTGTMATVGTGGMLAGGAAALPFAGLGGLLGLAGRGVEKLTNYATGDTDTPVDWSQKTTGQKVKSGLGYVGKGLLSPLSLLGLGVGAAGRGIEQLGRYVGGKQDTPVDWSGLSKGQKAKQALKYIGLGLISPLALPFLGIGALGRKLGVVGAIKGLGAKLKNFKHSTWDPSEPHQKEGLAGGGVGAGGAIAGGGVGGVAGFISSLVKGSDYTKMPEELRKVDLALKNRPEGEAQVSQVGQGFGAAGGIIGALGGLVGAGSGIRGLFRERGKKKLTRGVGRLGAGLGQIFAGTTLAGKSIATLAGSTGAAAQFMATAALPAQVAMSGVDVLKGGYMGIKAFSRHRALSKLAGKDSITADPRKLAFVEFAKEYMKKRGRTAGLNVLAGALGVTGGALMLSGFGAVAGVPLLIASAAVKLGSMLGPKIRDTIMDKWKGKAYGGGTQTYSEHKKAREDEMAQYAADNWGRSDIQAILKAMGIEQKAIDSFGQKTPAEIKVYIKAWIMRR